MAEWEIGYGTPSGPGDPSAGDEYGWGYGDPDGGSFGSGAQSGGYGSPFFFSPSAFVPLPLSLPYGAAPDDGGVLLTVVGAWPTKGPYRVRLVNSGGYVFPSDGRWCWSGVQGAGYDCVTDLLQQSLTFATPNAPPGVYAGRFYYGPAFSLSFDVPNLLTVVYRMRSPMTYRLRDLFPDWYATGPRLIADEVYEVQGGTPHAQNVEFPHGPMSEVLNATGEVLRATVGQPATRLTADLAPADTTAHVESTLEFGATGAVWVNSTRFTYTGKTDTTLTGVTTCADRVETFPSEAAVTLDAEAVPDDTLVNARLQGMRDTTVNGAESDNLTDLASFLGLPFPSGWDESSWRAALHALVMGPRSLPGGTWGFLRGVFQYAEKPIACTTSGAHPERLAKASGAFTADDVWRLYEIGGVLYRSVELGTAGAWLDMATVATPYWHAAAFGNGTVTAAQLAFAIEEPTPGPVLLQLAGRPATVIVRVWAPDVSDVPPSYLQPAGANPTPGGEPIGGEVLADASQAGDVTNGPHPWYIYSPVILDVLATVLQPSLPPGFFCEFRSGWQ